jgi:hypothetical protein
LTGGGHVGGGGGGGGSYPVYGGNCEMDARMASGEGGRWRGVWAGREGRRERVRRSEVLGG